MGSYPPARTQPSSSSISPWIMSATEIKLFNKWTFDDVQVSDMALQDYIAAKSENACFLPHSGGRWQKKRFKKAQCPIVERMTNSLMMHGRNNGKKVLACRIMKHTLEIINLLTGENPVQVVTDAVIASGAREDSCRIGSAAFRNIKTIAECLAEEIINAAKGSSNSYAIKKKDEIERVAKANR